MAFTWGEAGRIALIGFCSVFSILAMLWLSVTLISFLTRTITREPKPPKKDKTTQEGQS
jgi:Na+-transporting methylmalonyl-CoA/oxaloacetate decarboxylase gamma subunit